MCRGACGGWCGRSGWRFFPGALESVDISPQKWVSSPSVALRSSGAVRSPGGWPAAFCLSLQWRGGCSVQWPLDGTHTLGFTPGQALSSLAPVKSQGLAKPCPPNSSPQLRLVVFRDVDRGAHISF